MPQPTPEFLATAAPLLAWYYVLACALNVGALVLAARGRHWIRAALWAGFACGAGWLAAEAFAGRPLEMPVAWKASIDTALGPVTFTAGTFFMLVVLFVGRRFFVIPAVAWTGFNAALLFLGASMADPQFAAIVAKPDNVPIVAMVFLLAGFTWWGTSQAVENDDRIARGLGPVEADYAEPVLVWPEVIYLELIIVVLATVVLIVWSMALQAPLEEPANPVVTPNPSKAPWYFLGLQEMLVFFDASIAGVTLPILIILGLAAIPYLDFNPKGNGYYTIKQRPFAYLTFQFGFLQLWILLILIGTFMRGPNWNFFGLYEIRDPHKVLALNNVKLSEYFWVIWLGRSLPQAPPGSGPFLELGVILWREIAGIVLLAVYFLAIPFLLGRTLLRKFRRRMGLVGFTIMAWLLLMMLMLPIKMILRWTWNVSYLVSIPEYFANF